MNTVDSDLDKVQEKLHDSATLWTRAELLRWYNDGYRQFLAQSGAYSRILPLDVPGRHTYSCMFQWEDRHTTGTYWFPGLAALTATRQCLSAWEVEFLEDLTPTVSLRGITGQWERAYTTVDVHAHFEFGLPKEHERVRRLAWDDKLLIPVAVREFDEVDDAWMRRVGEPTWWTPGLGRSRTVEVYEIKTDYNQGWALELYENGIPRNFTGRTYSTTVGKDFPTNSYGYTTSGDADALTRPDIQFDPSSAFSSQADAGNAPSTGATQVGYRFTLNGDISNNTPGLAYYATQIWEVNDGDAGTVRGMFPWEFSHGAVIAQTADRRITMTGMGWRFTQAADDTSDGFGTQIWEKQQLDGDDVTAGETVSSFGTDHQFGAANVTFSVGAIRCVTSPDRQYLPLVTDATVMSLLGSTRDWRSTEDALSALEVVIPQQDLVETDEPELIPDQMQKYLRFYVLSCAFGREGEGQKPEIAAHYEARFKRGVALMRRLADVAHKDRMFVRDMPSEAPPRPPLVRLPSEFPRVW